MKLKYLLASGLFLSTAFVACTNDDFAEISAPANTDDAIALGEGFTINVGKSDAETRAAFNETLNPYWEEGDKIGAAWLHKVTKIGENNQVPVDGCSLIGSTYDMFYSNLPFTLIEGEGTNNGTFETVGNAFAGAYVLYSPYDPNVSMAGNEIPVSLKTYELDCADRTKNLTANMFSYSPVKFVPGGPQTDEFYLQQIPVLIRMKFCASEKLNMNLQGGVTIQNIVLMAEDATGDVLAEAGHIVPGTAPVAANYNYVLANGNDVFNANGLGGIAKYENVGNVDHLFIKAIGSDNADFQLLKEEVDTKKAFEFSILPLSRPATKLTVKIVTTDRGVYKREYNIASGEDKKVIDEFNKAATNGKGTETVELRVVLDMTEQDGVIYTADEFMKRWEAATTTGANPTLEVGTDLVLPEGLTCDNDEADVTVKGHKITVPSINIAKNTGVEFENEVVVEGDVFTSGASEIIAKNLAAENIEIQGQAELALKEAKKLTVASSGIVTVSGVDAESSIDVIEIQKGSTTIGKLTLGANLAVSELQSEGEVTLADNFTNEGNMVLSKLTTGNYTLTNKSNLTLNGEASGNVVNNADATLKINAVSRGLMLENKAAGVVDINQNVTLKTGSANKGTINVNNGTLAGTLENKSYIYLTTADAIVNVKSLTNNEGWIVLKNEDATLTGKSGVIDRTAYSVTSVEDLNSKPANVTWTWIDAPMTLEANTNLGDTYINANLTLKGNLTSANYIHVTETVNLNLANGVTSATFSFNTIWVEGLLNLADGISAKGKANSMNDFRNIRGGNVDNVTVVD